MTHLLQMMKWTAKYISDIATWIFRAQPLVAILTAIVLVVLFFVAFHPCLEKQIRLSGMGLQLLGVILVAIGLRQTRQAFEGHPTIVGRIKHWWSRRPTFGPKNQIVAAAGASFGISVGSARARTGPGPNTPLEQRLAMLEKQYVALFDEVGTLSAETKANTDELKSSLATERTQRQQADVQIIEQLKKAVVEDIPLASVGVIAFLLGITAGTASIEISSLFGSAVCN